MVKIMRHALESALHGAKEMHPDEFLCIFASDDGKVFDRILLTPLADYGPTHASFNDFLMPTGGFKASFHSHSNGVLRPSRQDLVLFSAKGAFHAIAGPPYTTQNLVFFDKRGKNVAFKLEKDGSATLQYQ